MTKGKPLAIPAAEIHYSSAHYLVSHVYEPILFTGIVLIFGRWVCLQPLPALNMYVLALIARVFWTDVLMASSQIGHSVYECGGGSTLTAPLGGQRLK